MHVLVFVMEIFCHVSYFIKVVDFDMPSLRLQHGSWSSLSSLSTCGSTYVLKTFGITVNLGPKVNFVCMLMSLYQ